MTRGPWRLLGLLADPIGSVIDELVRLNPALDGQIVGEDGAILPYVGIFPEWKERTPSRRPANPGQ